MSGMSKFLSSFHYAVKHCLTILWQILEYIQKSHFIFSKMVIKHLPKSEKEVPALVYPPCQICNSDTTNGSLVCFPALSVSIRFARRLAKCLQILYSVSDSLWIWEAFVPKTAAIPMSSKCSDHTTEPDFNFSFSKFCIIHAGQKYQKSNPVYEKHLFTFFFQLGSGFSLYPSQWTEKFKERHWISWKNFSLKGIYFNGARISVSAKYARMYLTSNLYLNHVDFKRT